MLILGADLAFSRTPIVTYHFHAVILWATLYCIFMWSFWGAQHQWVYKVLDWRSSSAPTYYVAIPLLLALAHFIWLTLAIIRFVIVEAIDKRRGGKGQGRPASSTAAQYAGSGVQGKAVYGPEP